VSGLLLLFGSKKLAPHCPRQRENCEKCFGCVNAGVDVPVYCVEQFLSVSHFLKRTLPLFLAFLALAWSQLFGIHRGYLAEIDGKIVQTRASHHHAGDTLESGHFVDYTPHKHDHHRGPFHSHDHEEPTHGHDHEPVDSHEDHRHHMALVEQPDLTQIQPSVSAPPLVLFTLWAVSDFLFAAESFAAATPILPPQVAEDRSPPASLLVAQCMVMLI
jgi:hypothetical protein